MGRPPIRTDVKVERKTIWLHKDLADQVVEVAGAQGFSEFARGAIERELRRRKKLAEKRGG